MQIGHGGLAASGDHDGDVTLVTGVTGVVSGTVDAMLESGIIMTGGSAAEQSVQIGHGGADTVGALSRNLFVSADNDGNLEITGGNSGRSWGMIGHCDGEGYYGDFGSGSSTGTRQGGHQIFVDGATILEVQNGNESNVHLLHRTRTDDAGGLSGLKSDPASYLGGNGYQYIVNGGTTGTGPGLSATGNEALENVGEIIAGNIGGGHVGAPLPWGQAIPPGNLAEGGHCR